MKTFSLHQPQKIAYKRLSSLPIQTIRLNIFLIVLLTKVGSLLYISFKDLYGMMATYPSFSALILNVCSSQPGSFIQFIYPIMSPIPMNP